MNANFNKSMEKVMPAKQEVAERIGNYEELYSAFTMEEAVVEANRCAQCPGRYCSQACPVNNNIPEFIKALQSGDVDGAYAEIEKVSPIPELCSRVCPQYKQCESNCTRSLYGEAVNIGKLERFVTDTYRAAHMDAMPTAKKNGKKVSIVGGGPAGLSAASRLVKDGFDVTVYDRNDRVGGLMMYGIPNMKLGKDALAEKVEILAKTGVKFEVNTEIKTKDAAAKIVADSDAVLLACGAATPRNIMAPGREGNGVYYAVDYLKAATKAVLEAKAANGGACNAADVNSTVNAKGLDVVIIGGGDTGCDCVGTATRQGAKSIRQLEMMPEETDPRVAAIPWTDFPVKKRTDYGQEDAIKVYGHDPREFLTTVKEFVRDGKGNLTGVVLIDLETAIEGTKVFQKEILGTEREVPAQMVIIAAGFVGCEETVTDAFGVERNARGNVKTEYMEHATNAAKVFTAGDMHSGQSVVAKAVRDGRDAAEEIEKFLI